MGQKYLIDTNVILDFMGGKLPVKSEYFLSEIKKSKSYLHNGQANLKSFCVR